MRKFLLAAAAATLLPATAMADAKVGEPAPAFEVTDIEGNTQKLEDYKGKIVVLEWTNPGCPFVVKHYGSGNMQKLQADAKEKGVVWLTVNSSAEGKQGSMTAEEAKAQIAKDKAEEAAYILDATGELGKLYGAKTTPHMFVIDADGKLSYAGAIDSTPSTDPADIEGSTNYVQAALDALQAGKQPEHTSTTAYGCSVKY